MSALSALLLVAGALDAAPVPAIAIDPCVDVDADEVRRLTAIELAGAKPTLPLTTLEISVTCEDGFEALRLTDRTRGQVTVRGIDLSASKAGDRDAKTRELALAIAELLRRAGREATAVAPRPTPPPAPPEPPRPPPPSRPDAFRLELGAAGVGVGWTGGEALFGADITGRLRVSRWLIADLRLGGRKTRPLDLEGGSLDGHGMAAAAGLSLDATPGMNRAGVSFGARLAGDWLRYAADHRGSVRYDGNDAAALSLAATATAFVVVESPLCLTVDAAAGTALHSILIRENGRAVSGLRGVLLSSAVGLAAQF